MIIGSVSFIIVVLIITVIVPLFIILHYITKWKIMKAQETNLGDGRVAVDMSKLEALSKTAKKLDERVQTLEKLLDSEAPGWRDS
ncbi:MAG: envelope stress response membrane protein PspB [Rhodospirillales bacterium]|nr:envelope stress response membrane protein PspB [Rhodospirillales bacterium]